jgi:NAD(P)H dehydrogenase (quinone)
MKVLVVLAHPEPLSFNAALAAEAVTTLREAGHEVAFSDLCRKGFQPVSDRRNFRSLADPSYFKQQIEERHATELDAFAADIDAEWALLEGCDLLIWQFPLWWFGLPAILKGWVDKVFAFERVYGGNRGIYETGYFRGRRALLSLTTGGPPSAYATDGFNGDLDAVLRPIQRGMLRFVGFDVLSPNVVHQPARLDAALRIEALEAWRERLLAIESEAPIDVGRY